MSYDRREFLKKAGLAMAAGVAIPHTAARAAFGPQLASATQLGTRGYGPLRPARDRTTGEVLLHLPKDFKYRLISQAGDIMSDGYEAPGRTDGMAAYDVGGATRVVRSHEVFFDPGAVGDPATAYDAKAGGSITTLEIDGNGPGATAWLTLNGLNAPCMGGPTPWGTYIACEESVNGPDANISFLGTELDLDEKHGYLFEVSPLQEPGEIAPATPIKAAGRMTHEAIAVDPLTGDVYQTEDDFAVPSGFYRYRPPVNPLEAGYLADDGVLEVLAIRDVPNAETHLNQTVGVSLPVEWIRIEDPDPDIPVGTSNDDASFTIMRDEALPKGAAIFARPEGLVYHEGKMIFDATKGGGPHAEPNTSSGYGEGWGQIWEYDIAAETLTLVFESPGPEVMDLPDNLGISPHGSLIICEDGGTDNYLRGLSPAGELFDFALNAIPGEEGQEFAGSVFSPDGRTMFVNIQYAEAKTFAIWGPWRRGDF